MKCLVTLFAILVAAGANAQQAKHPENKPASPEKIISTVPDDVITNDSSYWTISIMSTVGYTNTTPGAYYNTYKSAGGMIVKFKFTKDNRYQFLLYVQSNSYNIDIETWTQVEGSVTFMKDAKGQQIFKTTAEKGIYRIIKNGQTTMRPITDKELKENHSATYLWEQTMFNDDPQNIYLLMVNLNDHPTADVSDPKTIDPSWVSKFHISR